jgi:hypothetical protein
VAPRVCGTVYPGESRGESGGRELFSINNCQMEASRLCGPVAQGIARQANVMQAIVLLDTPTPLHGYCPDMNSVARSLWAACSLLWARCRRRLRIEDSRVGGVGAGSSWLKAGPGLIADDAARVPSCSDKAVACCLVTSFA